MCHTRVTIEGETLEMQLPVMDGANKAMKNKSYEYTTRFGTKTVEPASMFDINKTIMRCLVKNLAMFGLGLYIYAKEDMPTADKPEPEAPQPEFIDLEIGDGNWSNVVKFIDTMKSKKSIDQVMDKLNTKYKISAAVKKEITKLHKS